MAARIGAVALHVSDVDRARSFWCGALGYEPLRMNDEFRRPSGGAGPELHLDRGDATHLDLWTVETDDLQRETERLVGLGATRADDWETPPDADFVVLRDTEGNLFCIVSARR